MGIYYRWQRTREKEVLFGVQGKKLSGFLTLSYDARNLARYACLLAAAAWHLFRRIKKLTDLPGRKDRSFRPAFSKLRDF